MSTIDETVSFSLEVNVEHTETQIRRLETVLYRTLGLINRLGLSEKLSQQIAEIQRQIALLNKLRLAYLAVQTARMAAGDPIAWAMAGLAVAEAGVSIGETFGSYG